MNKMDKVLALSCTLTAVLGLSAVSAAHGSEAHFFAVNSFNLTGEQVVQNAFTTDAGQAKCTQATYEGTLLESEEIDELTLTSTYTGCQAFGTAATIDMNGCKYTVTGAGQPAHTAAVDITGCTSGKAIEITTAICKMTVPQQHGLGHVIFESAGGGNHVKAQATVSGISYQANGPLCPSMPTGQTKQNGQYTGEVTVKAYVDEGSELVTHNGHQYNRLICGGQWGLQTT